MLVWTGMTERQMALIENRDGYDPQGIRQREAMEETRQLLRIRGNTKPHLSEILDTLLDFKPFA